MTGYVRKLVDRDGRCFGFIAGDNGIDYFFLPSFVQKSQQYGFADFKIGTRVEFTQIPGPKANTWRAIEIRIDPNIRRTDGDTTGPVSQPS